MPETLQEHKKEWDELEQLLKRCRRGTRGLSPEEIGRLDVLYRRTTIHLAQISTKARDRALAEYLNTLCAAAHSVIYLPPRQNPLKGFWRFLADGFARAVARTWRFHAASALLMIGGFIVALLAVRVDPSASYAILPAGEFRQPGATEEQLLKVLRYGRSEGDGFKFLFASFLFSHNLKVGIFSMATGILAGIPAMLLMLYNGMILGAMSAVYHASGIRTEFWAWILPHGVTELTAIALCGGIGLRLGWAVVAPGTMTRGDSIVAAAKEGARIVVGVAIMLCLAAIIESYIRQSHLATWTRLVLAAVTGLIWAGYFGRGMVRERHQARAKPLIAG